MSYKVYDRYAIYWSHPALAVKRRVGHISSCAL